MFLRRLHKYNISAHYVLHSVHYSIKNALIIWFDLSYFLLLRKRPAADDESGPSTSGAAAKKPKGKTGFGDFSSW